MREQTRQCPRSLSKDLNMFSGSSGYNVSDMGCLVGGYKYSDVVTMMSYGSIRVSIVTQGSNQSSSNHSLDPSRGKAKVEYSR